MVYNVDCSLHLCECMNVCICALFGKKIHVHACMCNARVHMCMQCCNALSVYTTAVICGYPLIPFLHFPSLLSPSFFLVGRDSEEKLKELTEEEKAELQKQDNQR